MPGFDVTENEIRYRLKEPNLFEDSSFARKEISPGVSLVLGKLKGQDSMTAQAIRFDKEKFTLDQVKSWVSDHKKDFELKETDQKYSIIGKEIFSVGTWNGDQYDAKDLEEMCRAYRETSAYYKPYMKLGHQDDQVFLQKEGLPAAGWIENLRVNGTKLVCDLVDIPEKIYKLIKDKAYRYVSSEILWDIDFLEKKYKRMLAGVALLGAEMPAVVNLNDFINLYKLDARFMRTYTINNNGGNIMPGTKAIPANEDESKKLNAEETQPKAPVVEPPKAPVAADKKEMGDVETRIAALEQMIAELKAKLGESNEMCAKYKLDKEKAEIETFLAENKTAPAAIPYARLLLGPDKKEYAMNDKKLSKFELLKEYTKVYSESSGVNLEENSQKGDESTQQDVDDIKVDKIAKYAKEKGVSFRDAYDQLRIDESADVDEDDDESEED